MTDIDNLTKMTYADLTHYAGISSRAHQQVSVEVTRRLTASVDEFSATAKRQTNWRRAQLSLVGYPLGFAQTYRDETKHSVIPHRDDRTRLRLRPQYPRARRRRQALGVCAVAELRHAQDDRLHCGVGFYKG